MKMMRKKLRKNRNKRDAGKVITGLLLGSVFGAAVALLMSPVSGQELRQRISGQTADIREKIRTAAGNVENRARELTEDLNNRTGSGVRYSA